MTELEKVEREITTLKGSVRSSTRALENPDLSAEGARRERASIALYRQHLGDLITKRDNLQSLVSD
jgi:hypothetical protein